MTNVRSIDLGYGYVKYTMRNPHGDSPAVVTRQIPALAVPAVSQLVVFDGVKLPQTVPVNVKETLYQVGPDTPLLLAGRSGRELSDAYSRSDRYEALMLGTLSYIGDKVIDVLVLGLPVSKFAQERERLAGLFRGSLKVPMHGENDRTVKVDVGQVIVLPQPVGGFLDAKDQMGQGEKWRGASLVIDPGFYTYDWVVVAENSTFIASRSSALHGGVASILRVIADHLQVELGGKISDLFPIDTALRTGEPLHLDGKEISLEKFKPQITTVCKSHVSEMVAQLGESRDLRRIVLCGGGARLYKASIEEAFPGREVHVSREPMYANVRGFQGFGEEVARRLASVTA